MRVLRRSMCAADAEGITAEWESGRRFRRCEEKSEMVLRRVQGHWGKVAEGELEWGRVKTGKINLSFPFDCFLRVPLCLCFTVNKCGFVLDSFDFLTGVSHFWKILNHDLSEYFSSILFSSFRMLIFSLSLPYLSITFFFIVSLEYM